MLSGLAVGFVHKKSDFEHDFSPFGDMFQKKP
jgi:hypothetical protein